MREKQAFVHLHVHTDKSLADAMLRPDELAKTVKEYGMDAVAITDHGNMFNAINFYSACKRENVKPIIGIETYVAPRTNQMREHGIDDANYHLVLLAENNQGYQNLINIASDSSVNGMYYKPRTDKDRLRQWHEGVIASSACLGGEVQAKILSGDLEGAKQAAIDYNDIFGQGNFFLELQDHGLKEQAHVNKILIEMSRELGIPLIATNDCHYLTHSDYEAHDVLMAIQAKVTVDSDKRKKYGSDQFYLKKPEEMQELFSYIPEALENTVKIAERCHVDIDFKSSKLPPYTLPDSYKGTNFEYMMEQVMAGAKRLYGEITKEIQERIDYEAGVVNSMGYVNYFLIVWDFFRFCVHGTDRADDPEDPNWVPIYTGPGRGSGAGSILTYCLGITKIDPLKYKLLFERFLDPSRISMPDIDSDFEDSRRQEVIDYVIRKYGRQSVCQIISYGTLAARACIRAVGRALDLPYALQDKVAKMIPKEPDITLKSALEKNADLFALYDSDETVHKLINIALRLEGISIHTSTHAAGVLITDQKGVTAHVPIWKNEEAIVSQYDMTILEKLNLLKMDFLGLKTLGVIHEAIDMIKKLYGVTVDLDKLYLGEDLAPLKLLSDGNTDGIFQLEGSGLTDFVVKLKPNSIAEWVAAISLYRPGPMQFIPTFLANRRNPEEIVYPFPELKEILGETYGVLAYQEQCMLTVVAVAGYEKSDSDSFRKVVAKKKKHLIPLHKKWFIDGRDSVSLDEYGKMTDYGHPIPGGVKMGHNRQDLADFFDKMEDFGKYAFNKSHAACYAIVGYVTAWLKYYYPVVFMACLMNSVQGNQAKIARYIAHCRRELNIEIVAPDVNICSDRFVPTKDGKILFTLNALRVSVNIMNAIKREQLIRPFSSLSDFVYRTYNQMNKADLRALACIGAFRQFGYSISQLAVSSPEVMDRVRKTKDAIKRANKSGRTINIEERLQLDEVIIKDIDEFPERVLLALEKEYLGIYLTGHPINQFMIYDSRYSNFHTADLDYTVDDATGTIILNNPGFAEKEVRFIAMFREIKVTITKERKQKMAITEVEDLTGYAKMLIWPNSYAAYEDEINETDVYEFCAKVEVKAEEAPILILKSLKPLRAPKIKRIIIHEDNKENLEKLMNKISSNALYRGETPVYIVSGHIKLLLSREYWVNLDTINLETISYEII